MPVDFGREYRIEDAIERFGLSRKQATFLRIFLRTGSAQEAAKAAGYAAAYGSSLLKKPEIRQALRYIHPYYTDDILNFWYEVMNDPSQRIMARLRASENLAKALGMFVEKREISGPNGQPLTNIIQVNIDFIDDDGDKPAAA